MSNIGTIEVVIPVTTGNTPASEYVLQAKGYATSAESAKNSATSSASLASSSASAAAASALLAEEYANNLDVFSPKGFIDASTNPNYPAGVEGDYYVVSVAGKVGGASGIDVNVADMVLCMQNTVSGVHSVVGDNWKRIITNTDGVVVGPSVSTVDNIATFNATNGKLIKDSNYKVSDFIQKGSGTNGQIMTLVSGNPAWADAPQSGAQKWTAVAGITRLSSSTFSVTDNATNQSIFSKGRGLRVTTGTTYSYHIVETYSSGTITVAGEPLPATITTLEWSLLPVIQFELPLLYGYFGTSASTTLLSTFSLRKLTWKNAPARVVKLYIESSSVDSGATKERINLYLRGADSVLTDNSNNGLELTAANTEYSNAVTIDGTKNRLNYGDSIELKCQGYGTAKDSTNLRATIVAMEE